MSENDWENAFGGNNWKEQMNDEILETVNHYFKNIKSAFEFFVKNS